MKYWGSFNYRPITLRDLLRRHYLLILDIKKHTTEAIPFKMGNTLKQINSTPITFTM